MDAPVSRILLNLPSYSEKWKKISNNDYIKSCLHMFQETILSKKNTASGLCMDHSIKVFSATVSMAASSLLWRKAESKRGESTKKQSRKHDLLMPVTCCTTCPLLSTGDYKKKWHVLKVEVLGYSRGVYYCYVCSAYWQKKSIFTVCVFFFFWKQTNNNQNKK